MTHLAEVGADSPMDPHQWPPLANDAGRAERAFQIWSNLSIYLTVYDS